MKCPECRKTMTWTGDHDSKDGDTDLLMVSWRCKTEDCDVCFIDVHWSLV